MLCELGYIRCRRCILHDIVLESNLTDFLDEVQVKIIEILSGRWWRFVTELSTIVCHIVSVCLFLIAVSFKPYEQFLVLMFKENCMTVMIIHNIYVVFLLHFQKTRSDSTHSKLMQAISSLDSKKK